MKKAIIIGIAVIALVLIIGAVVLVAIFAGGALDAFETPPTMQALLDEAGPGMLEEEAPECEGVAWVSFQHEILVEFVERLYEDWGRLDSAHLDYLEEALAPLRETGRMTAVEQMLDPAAHSGEEILQNLHQFLSESPLLAEEEEELFQSRCEFINSKTLQMLALRAQLDVRSDNLFAALETLTGLLDRSDTESAAIRPMLKEAVLPALSLMLSDPQFAASPPVQEVVAEFEKTRSREDVAADMRACLDEAAHQEAALREGLPLGAWVLTLGKDFTLLTSEKKWQAAVSYVTAYIELLHEDPLQQEELRNEFERTEWRSYALMSMSWLPRIHRGYWQDQIFSSLPRLTAVIEEYAVAHGEYPSEWPRIEAPGGFELLYTQERDGYTLRLKEQDIAVEEMKVLWRVWK